MHSLDEDYSHPIIEIQAVKKEQLADLLNFSISYIDKLMAKEGLPHFKVGRSVRFRVKEVLVWLQKRRKP